MIFIQERNSKWSCPKHFCICKGRKVFCQNHRKRLWYIPRLPKNTKHLEFAGNFLPSIDQETLRNITKLRIKRLVLGRNQISFTIVNFPYICSKIPLSPAYGVYISQLIRYARACSTYDQFLSRSRLQTDKLMLQGFLQSRLMSVFRKFCGRYSDRINTIITKFY